MPASTTLPTAPHIRQSSARLRAVQLVYAMLMDDGSAQIVLSDSIDPDSTLNRPADKSVDMLVDPDQERVTRIVGGVERRRSDIMAILGAHLQEKQKNQMGYEPLLKSILMCGVYELLEETTIDAPIIINDYVNVTDAFYDGNEKKLVNALLDNAKKTIR